MLLGGWVWWVGVLNPVARDGPTTIRSNWGRKLAKLALVLFLFFKSVRPLRPRPRGKPRKRLSVYLTHLTAQAGGYHGGPTDILRGHQADTLHCHARLGLPDEEATGQSASRT